MSAAGEDILAWTEAAITRVENAARHATEGPWRTHDTHLDHGGHTATILAGEGNDTELLAWLPTMSHEPWDDTRNAWRNADHIALNDPEAVLRRCASDRKLLELHKPEGSSGECRTCVEWSETEHWHCPVPFPCDTFLTVAEGYNWQEGGQ